MSEQIDTFFGFFEEQYPVLRRVKGKNYGHIKLKPNGLVSLQVSTRKKTVSVALITDGGKKDISVDALLEWAKETAIVRDEYGDGNYFDVQRGAKNKNKIAIQLDVGFESLDQLEGDDCQEVVSKAISRLLDDLGDLAEVRERKASDSLDRPSEESIDQVVTSLKVKMDQIIEDADLENAESSEVRPGYGYDKFYLDRVDGSYDESLQSLIHYVMWEDKLYHKLLSKKQIEEVAAVIEDDPNSIYGPDLDDDNYEENEALDDTLKNIFWQVITHVGEKLSAFDFFDGREFVELGYSNSVEEDDDSSDEFESDDIDVDKVNELCKAVGKQLVDANFFSSLIGDGVVREATFSLDVDPFSFAFDLTLAMDDRTAGELSFDEEDSIDSALRDYFGNNGLWEPLTSLGCSQDDLGGFRVALS